MYFEFHQERRHGWTPAVDVCERAREIVILVEMPGIRRTDVKISWHDGILSIVGRKSKPSDVCDARYHCLESSSGNFRRDIAIEIPIDAAHSRAELRDGLMRILLPKISARSESSNIPILD